VEGAILKKNLLPSFDIWGGGARLRAQLNKAAFYPYVSKAIHLILDSFDVCAIRRGYQIFEF
jgi:hypothetical protein